MEDEPASSYFLCRVPCHSLRLAVVVVAERSAEPASVSAWPVRVCLALNLVIIVREADFVVAMKVAGEED